MNSDLELAELLEGAAPSSAAKFRLETYARIGERARRAAAWRRALRLILVCCGCGLAFPLAAMSGLRPEVFQPLFAAALVVALIWVLARTALGGPRAVIALLAGGALRRRLV